MATNGFSPAQKALLRLIIAGAGSPRHLSRRDARRLDMEADFDLCRRSGLIVSADYECSSAGDQFLDTPEAQRAIALGTMWP